MSKAKQELSTEDRLLLIQTLNALPKTQFDEIVFALKPPPGNVPDNPAPQGERVAALLKWVESPIGPGLLAIDHLLQTFIPTKFGPQIQHIELTLKGEIDSTTATRMREFVDFLRSETKGNSISISFFEEGSIKLVLSGTPEDLEKLQKFIESGGPESLDMPQVETVESVDSNSTKARKARLIQVLVPSRPPTLALLQENIREKNKQRRRRLQTWFRSSPASDKRIDLKNADFRGSNLRYVDLRRVDLREADLSNADLSGAALNEAELRAAKLSNAYLSYAYLIGADLIGADLSYADLFRADLSYADLSYANLSHANLSEADLRAAKLRFADFSGADFREASVDEAVFGNNEGLTKADKEDLIQRGAIFPQDPPTSDVSSLARR